jgi:hypothetical protein
MADETLLMLFDEVRGKTLRLLEGVTENQARWAPAGLANHILWHAGHIYVVVEALTVVALGKTLELPAGWHVMFSWESRPADVPGERWPALIEVVEALRLQHQRLRVVIAALSAEELAAPPPRAERGSVRHRILHGLHDEANHGGEIWLLRKMQNTGKG